MKFDMQQPSVWLKRSSSVPAIELRRNWRSSIGYALHTHAEYSIGLVDERQALYQSGQQQCFIKVGDSEVAQTLGFADQAHFQRHFKRRLALTPKTYQQQFIKH